MRANFLAVALLFCGVLLWPTPTAGQHPPNYATRDLPVILEALGISDPDRQQILQELFADYDMSYRDLVGSLKADTAGIYTDTIGIECVVQGLARTESFLHQRAALASVLESNIGAVLTKPELAEWSRVMADLRRKRLLPRARLIAEGLNVAQLVVDQLPQLPDLESPEITQIVAEWMVDVDAAMLRRAPLMISGNVVYRRMINEERYREAFDVMSALVNARAALRDINLAASTAIGERLPREQAAQWRDAVRLVLGRRPLDHRLAAAWRRLEQHPDCADGASSYAAESLTLFELDTRGLADALLATRIQMEELAIRAPMAQRVGIEMDRSPLDNAYIALLQQVQAAEASALQRACAVLDQKCCSAFLGTDHAAWPRPATPPEMINPGEGKPDPPSPHGDPASNAEAPPPEADSPHKELPDPMPPSPPQPETPLPGLEPSEDPDPPDPFGG